VRVVRVVRVLRVERVVRCIIIGPYTLLSSYATMLRWEFHV
jgi:hypothetical protein